jgi:hypothetical protein
LSLCTSVKVSLMMMWSTGANGWFGVSIEVIDKPGHKLIADQKDILVHKLNLKQPIHIILGEQIFWGFVALKKMSLHLSRRNAHGDTPPASANNRVSMFNDATTRYVPRSNFCFLLWNAEIEKVERVRVEPHQYQSCSRINKTYLWCRYLLISNFTHKNYVLEIVHLDIRAASAGVARAQNTWPSWSGGKESGPSYQKVTDFVIDINERITCCFLEKRSQEW